MKVLHIDTEMTWRGGENQLRLLLEGLKNQPVESYLAAPPESAAIERLAPLARVVPTPMRGIRAAWAAQRLASFCRREKIDVIDCQTARAHGVGVLIKKLAPHVALVVHRRVDYVPKTDWLSHAKYQSPGIAQYIAISGAIKSILVDAGIAPEKISVVRSAVDGSALTAIPRADARRRIAEELGIPEERPLVASIGYLTEQKGHETLLAGLAVAKAAGTDFHCFVAGDGHLRPRLEAQRQELGLTHDVTFLGIRNDVPHLLRAADILAMPSNFEGLGTTLLDALHAGCAVVATRVGGIPEVITDGVTGLLSAVGDGKAHGENLVRVLGDPELRQRLARAGKEHIDREFSLEAMVQGNLSVYQRVLGRRDK